MPTRTQLPETPDETEALVMQAAACIEDIRRLGGRALMEMVELLLIRERALLKPTPPRAVNDTAVVALKLVHTDQMTLQNKAVRGDARQLQLQQKWGKKDVVC